MSKSDIVNELAERNNLDQSQSESIVISLFDQIRKALTAGRRTEIRGFGSFIVKDYQGYWGRNPKTGEKIWVRAKRLPAFKVGKDLQRRLNQGEPQ
jgi:integration host factor subunit beta